MPSYHGYRDGIALMPFDVLTGEISHETNSFNLQETDEEAFRNRYVLMAPKRSPSAAQRIRSWLASSQPVEHMAGRSRMYSVRLPGQAAK